MELTTSYKFKLYPTKEQEPFLLNYFSRFAKAVNFAAKKIPIVEKDQQKNYDFVKEGIKGECSYCQKSYTSCKTHKPEGKNVWDRNKKCGNCNQGALLNKKAKNNSELVCQKCWNKYFSIGKILYATRGRKRAQYGDIKDATKLHGTEYALAFKRANNILKSYKQQLKRVKFSIRQNERQLNEWQEVLENASVTEDKIKEWKDRYKYNEEIQEIIKDLEVKKSKELTARYIVPRQPKQRVDKYKHILKETNLSKGKSEALIKKTIEALEKTKEKLNKRLKEAKIQFSGNIVDLQNTAVRTFNKNFVELSIDGKKEKFPLNIEEVNYKKGRNWLLNIIEQIQKGRLRYPLLLKLGRSFYLSYPFREILENPKIDAKTKVMGIDRGINQIAVTTVIEKKDGVPSYIKFYSGRELMRTKIKYQLIRKKLTGTKSVNKRRAKFGKKVVRISEYLLHSISRKVVNQAKELSPIVISLENLKFIQGEKRPKRGSPLQERETRFLLSNFTYGKLQKFIEYKALRAGIPVKYIEPEYTSQMCYKCHKAGIRNSGFFKCLNPECKHSMNADLNAAINIANSLYKKLNS